MAINIIDKRGEFILKWDFDRFHKRNLEAVKSIGDKDANGKLLKQVARYDPIKQHWIIDALYREQVLELTKTHHAQYIDAEYSTPEVTGELPPIAELKSNLAFQPSVILRPYQKQGIAQAAQFVQHSGGALIGDEQGLGKTIQSIGAILLTNSFPCLVICPSSTKYNWQREFHKFSYKKAIVLDAQKMNATQRKNWHQYVLTGMADVVIINYESIAAFLIESYPKERTIKGNKKPFGAKDVIPRPCMKMFKAGIIDESQRCKDETTLQAKFLLRIFFDIKHKLLLSGTPVVNKPKELWPQLAILGVLNKFFGGKDYYLKRYCEGGKGAANLKELNFKLRLNCFFRREKKDVAKDLPDKMRQTIICEITNRVEYKKAQDDFENWLREKGASEESIDSKMKGEAIVKMMQLKQLSALGKFNDVKEFVSEVLEAGEKMILFCHLHEIVDKCLEEWPDAVTVTGRDSAQNRQINIDRFQGDPKCQLIVCNHKAAGVGITLTASSRVAFIEYPWTYADCVQCEDRAHRIGQKNAVMCTYFLGDNTIDVRMWEIISKKMEIGNAITGATDNFDEMQFVNKLLTSFNV